MRRAQEPNLGLWSPPGGKLHTNEGESPHASACREAREEIGITVAPNELHLTGIVTETGSEGNAHWLMFLFEMKTRLKVVPRPHREGDFAFHALAAISELAVPETDREMIWPLFWKHRGGFFAAHCATAAGKPNRWTLDQSNVKL